MTNKPLTAPGRPSSDKATLVLLCLLTIDSLHFVFARLLVPHLPPATGGMYVLGVATVEVALIVAIVDRIRLALLGRHLGYFLSIGFLVASSTVLNYTAVAYIDPGTASLLSKAAILFSLGLGLIWLRERLTVIQVIGALIALGGVFIIAFQPGDYWRTNDQYRRIL